MNLELNDEQRALLMEVVDSRIAELGPEIHHCRQFEYKEHLREKRDILNAILLSLQTAESGAAGEAITPQI